MRDDHLILHVSADITESLARIHRRVCPFQTELVESIGVVESSIAVCMNDAGFEYVAVDYNTVCRGLTSDESHPGLCERQYFQRHGFGISTLYTGRRSMAK